MNDAIIPVPECYIRTEEEVVIAVTYNEGAPFFAYFAKGGRPRTSTVRIPLENFAVRTDAHQPQWKIVRFFVDKKQVGLQRSLAMVRIFTRQRMIVESRRQGMIRRQK